MNCIVFLYFNLCLFECSCVVCRVGSVLCSRLHTHSGLSVGISDPPFFPSVFSHTKCEIAACPALVSKLVGKHAITCSVGEHLIGVFAERPVPVHE